MPEVSPVRKPDVVNSQSLTLKVQLFAAAREVAQHDVVNVVLPPTSTVADLRAAIVEEVPALSALAPSLLVAVNSVYADDGVVLTESCEIAVFPPVSGG